MPGQRHDQQNESQQKGVPHDTTDWIHRWQGRVPPGRRRPDAHPKGPVEIETTKLEATLSWVEGETHGAAAMPLADFKRYVTQGAIALH